MDTTIQQSLSLEVSLRILSVNCNPSLSSLLEGTAGALDHQVQSVPDLGEVKPLLDRGTLDLVVLEPARLQPEWYPALRGLREKAPSLVLLVFFETADDRWLSLLDPRLDFFLSKPVFPDMLRLTLGQIGWRIALERNLAETRREGERCRTEIVDAVERQKEVTIEKDLTYRELLLAYSRLQDVNQKKNNFLSMATHELRTPVTVIKGYHRILLDDRLGQLLPEQRKVLMESEENCNRLVKIINSLLNLSRIEAGRLELIYQENDLAENIRSVLPELEESLNRKQLRLVVNLEKAIPRFKYDREKVSQVFTSLLENSIKFTPTGGEIHLSAQPLFWERRSPTDSPVIENERAEQADSSLPAGPLPNAVKVEVSDTGIGISPQYQQEIFEEFTQVAIGQTKKSGLGLGLAIARRIIEAHGGKIWVDGRVDSGSKFVFLLPFSPVEPLV